MDEESGERTPYPPEEESVPPSEQLSPVENTRTPTGEASAVESGNESTEEIVVEEMVVEEMVGDEMVGEEIAALQPDAEFGEGDEFVGQDEELLGSPPLMDMEPEDEVEQEQVEQVETEQAEMEAPPPSEEVDKPPVPPKKATTSKQGSIRTASLRSGRRVVVVRRPEIPMIDEVIYKPAARLIQDPTLPLSQRPCVLQRAGSSVKGAAGGSNRQSLELNRSNLLQYKFACCNPPQTNPAATIPMRATQWKTPSKVRAPKAVEEWKIREEKDKDKRDHELAMELGYETLVGNLLYIDIPRGKDINRSWQSFLSDDLLEWGFPYEKGTFERPRMKQPEPYLAHQVREKLWKYPRTRLYQAAQEDPTT